MCHENEKFKESYSDYSETWNAKSYCVANKGKRIKLRNFDFFVPLQWEEPSSHESARACPLH